MIDDDPDLAKLRALVSKRCHTPLLIGAFVPVEESQRQDHMRRELATYDEMLHALDSQAGFLRAANEYLRGQILLRDAAAEVPRSARQGHIAQWCAAAFGIKQATSVPQRGLRLLEEAVEAAQAAGVSEELATKLVAYVYSRPTGELGQELGGVGVCVLALAAAAGLDADRAEIAEVDRVISKPIEQFTARNQAKNDAGFHTAKVDP